MPALHEKHGGDSSRERDISPITPREKSLRAVLTPRKAAAVPAAEVVVDKKILEFDLAPHQAVPDARSKDAPAFAPLSKGCTDLLDAMSGPVVLELNAGSAGFTAAIIARGVEGIAIDHVKNEHTTKTRVLHIDMTRPGGQAVIRALCATGRVQHVHAAPPCGTGSRAREIKIPQYLIDQGAPEPVPLRSNEHPRGLPDLVGVSLLRVKSANIIYDFIAALIMEFPLITFSVENPSRAYIWLFEAYIEIAAMPGWTRIEYQGCMHGGRRPKWSCWLTNVPELTLLSLNGKCDNSHVHLPYSVKKSFDKQSFGKRKWNFATNSEAEYPKELCALAADAIIENLRNRGFRCPIPTFKDDEGVPEVKRRRLAAAVGLSPWTHAPCNHLRVCKGH